MIYLLFISALSLSAIAEYYSIIGLIAIFAASPIPIAIMGVSLGFAKLVVASWLYRNWNTTSILMKSYFCSAVVILMFITSMGVFGALSKAHLEHGASIGDSAAKVELINEKIKTQKENIDANRNILTQLDAQVNSTLSRSTDEAGARRASLLRRSQGKERTRISEDISKAQAQILLLNQEKEPFQAEVRKVEVEVGPIKYIAELIYTESDTETLEKAVRFVILLIVFVFDPLAVLMFIAFNQTLKQREEEKKVVPLVSVPIEPINHKIEPSESIAIDETCYQTITITIPEAINKEITIDDSVVIDETVNKEVSLIDNDVNDTTPGHGKSLFIFSDVKIEDKCTHLM